MRAPTICAVVCALLAAAAPANAGLDIDLSGSVSIGDNTDLFFGISSRYFDRDRAVVRQWGGRYHDPDDLAVALFLSRHSGKSLDAIFTLRRGGTSWWDISVRYGVRPDVWFVPVRHDPGPPYGKAYGYWKKHRRDRRQAIVLSDLDARNLVAVRMVHEYYGVSVETAMQWRSSGSDLRVLMTNEYHKRHGKGPAGGSKSASRGKGRGHGPGKGHGKKK
jgi:hypothetical protein